MLKHKSLVAFIVTILFVNSFVQQVNAAVLKSSELISDKTTVEFCNYYNSIPLELRTVFENDGGNVIIYPENIAVSGVDASGWNAPGTLTGYYDTYNIYLNAKTVERKKNFYTGTAKRVTIHEFGHFVNAKSNEILYGAKSYTITEEFKQAYMSEYGNALNIKDMNEGLKQSFMRVSSPDEYYANIFAGLILARKQTKKYFPVSSSLVERDIALITK